MVTSLGGREHADKAAVANVWAAAVGPEVARHTYVRGVRRGELVVAVDSHTWSAQLQAMGEQLKDRLNEEIGKTAVHRIRFEVSSAVDEERSQRQGVADTARGYGGDRVVPEELSDEEMEHAESLVADIESGPLREAALRAIVAEKQWQKGAREQGAESAEKPR
jgi:hypothetical protein